MKCEECRYFDDTYWPNRCTHDRNTIYPEDGGMYCKQTASEMNPSNNCGIGKSK